MINKSTISKFLRDNNLLFFSDKVRFYVMKFKNRKENAKFKKNHPNIKLPPDYLIYESFQMKYENYYFGGKNTAIWLKENFEKFITLDNTKILDWGCGPARVIRHFPEILKNAEFFGTDYNQKTIDWDKKHIANVAFNHNTLEAKLPYENKFFDVIYGISIFTHLSEEKHFEWYHELYRILKPNGILLLTLQGNAFLSILTNEEKNIFENGKILIRGNVLEGHRTYSAFHPDDFVKKLFSEMEILDHIPSTNINGKLEQDVWIFRKK